MAQSAVIVGYYGGYPSLIVTSHSWIMPPCIIIIYQHYVFTCMHLPLENITTNSPPTITSCCSGRTFAAPLDVLRSCQQNRGRCLVES